jgi:CRP/FNR family transcriptional regulator, cyclic AMP receptor protein
MLPDIENFLDHCERQHYKTKSVLVSAGEASESFFFVLDSSLSVILKSDDGQDMVVNYVNPGDFFGEVGLYKRKEKIREATVQAKTACEVAEIRYDKFLEIRDEFPEILYAIGCQMADRLTNATKKLHDLAFVDTRGRILNALHDLCEQPDAMTHPDGMQIKVSRQELARIVGCSREVAGRLLKILEEEGQVAVSGHTMVIPRAK